MIEIQPRNRKREKIQALTQTLERDPVAYLRTKYATFYSDHKNKSDCPEATLHSLKKRAHPYISKLNENDWVLDMGAGRQIFEKIYRQTHGKSKCRWISADIASFPAHHLLAREYLIEHITANCADLPLPDESISLTISNMALDFMPEKAISELARTLKKGSFAFVNLHHSALVPANLEQQLKYPHSAHRHRDVLLLWKHLKEKEILTDNSEKIRNRFVIHGLAVTSLIEATDGIDTWWEVDLVKPEQLML